MKFRPFLWLTIVTLPALLVLIGLGSWQLQRLQWKNDLIASFETRSAADAIAIPAANAKLDDLEFSSLALDGVFQHGQETLLTGRTYEGNAGFHIITPFILENNEIIYINRGWVPKKYADKKTRKFSLLEENVKVVGLVRLPQKKGYFVPENEPENGFWFTIIPEELNRHLNIIGENKFYIDELNIDEKLKLPMPANGKVQVPNNHLQYAITWYSLALGLLIVYFAWHRQNGFLKIN